MDSARLNLSLKQRTELFAGQPTRITFPGSAPCPIQKGHVERLSAHVWLEVTGLRKSKSNEWVLVYTLHNNRLGQRYLSNRRGDERGYSHSGGSDVDPEAGEAVDEFTQAKLTKDARERERASVGEFLAAAEEVRAIFDAKMSRPEFRKLAGRDVWLVRSKLDRLIRNQRRKVA